MLQIADWSGSNQDRKYQNKYMSAFGNGQQYSYIHDEDESSFQLVDTSRAQRPTYQRSRFKFSLVSSLHHLLLNYISLTVDQMSF